MYDKFPDHTYYLYVGDRHGDPIPVHELTGINTSKLKKPYDKELNRTRKRLGKRKLELTVEERRSAGETTLQKLYNDAPAAGKRQMDELAPLQLFHVWIYSEGAARPSSQLKRSPGSCLWLLRTERPRPDETPRPKHMVSHPRLRSL